MPVVPVANPMTVAKVELGRFLFYDKRLSGNGTTSCGSCHQQDKAFTDGRAQAIGSTGEVHPRSAQGLANVIFSPTLTWADPKEQSLEAQMETPLFGIRPVEMGVNDDNREQILQRLRGDTGYPARFASAFPGDADPFNWPNIIKAIAAFERSLLSGNSRYDKRSSRGDRHSRTVRREAAPCSSPVPTASAATATSTSTTLPSVQRHPPPSFASTTQACSTSQEPALSRHRIAASLRSPAWPATWASSARPVCATCR